MPNRARGFTDGSTDVVASSRTTQVITSATKTTFSFWMFLITAPAAVRQIISSDDGNVTTGLSVLIDATSKMNFKVTNSGTDMTAKSATAVSTNVWTHVAITWNGDNINSGTSTAFYYNGLATTLATGGDGLGTHGTTAQTVKIGSGTFGNAPGARLAEMAFWRRVIGKNEIFSLFRGTSPRAIPELAVYYPLGLAGKEPSFVQTSLDGTVTGTTLVDGPPNIRRVHRLLNRRFAQSPSVAALFIPPWNPEWYQTLTRM